MEANGIERLGLMGISDPQHRRMVAAQSELEAVGITVSVWRQWSEGRWHYGLSKAG